MTYIPLAQEKFEPILVYSAMELIPISRGGPGLKLFPATGTPINIDLTVRASRRYLCRTFSVVSLMGKGTH